MTDERTVLAWIDLETTGLKPITKHRILEFAVVFTDLELNQLAVVGDVVVQPIDELTPLMDEYVTNMHTENGLLAAIAERAPVSYADGLMQAEGRIIAKLNSVRNLVSDHEAKIIFVIAGSTVGFDKGYIEYYMPSLFAELHYRQLDVSSYKVGFPEIFGTATSDTHRAMADIRASIQHHRHMRRIVQSVGPFVLNSPEL